ncbi:O-methyltransferase-domain-containing protein [Aspergillus pseudotamarii]|uniref:O-methyltransferase-domain-containing protein n=1 Tax=Aspergillus pseudotamarii TaxID=132259 RepID=A0A5N6SGJ6_ASPPS|nr:O-methyltransferase-domain-containing protein [Aspergillus pseudotamarii]KAE8133792.1 O-methyltransferase-domain-containing protein [Aspergillus pseudotamarii]
MGSYGETHTLTTLADVVKESAGALQRLLEESQLPQPSFSPGGRQDWSDAQSIPAILAVRSNLIDAAQTLLNLALGPTDILAGYAGPCLSEIEVLRVLDSLGVADVVPLDGEISIPDLASKVGVRNVHAFEKQLRFAFLMGMFRRTPSGGVAHTALSAAMPASSPYISLRLGRTFCQGGHEIATALRNGAGKKGIPCALADPKGLGRPAFVQLEDEPDGKGMERYSTGMIGLYNHHAGHSYLPFIHGFDWDWLGPEDTVVDVGGGNGHIEGQIVPLIPGGNFIIQDQPSNREGAEKIIQENGLAARVQYQPHDFFSPQPELPGGRVPKVYTLFRVLQDWEDADAVRILKHLVPAMERFDTKLWIMNRILPDELNTMPRHSERMLRNLDLLVFTLSGGGERNASHMHRMLKMADERLTIKRSSRPLNSLFSFLEVSLEK